MRLYIGLLHYPVYNRNNEVIASAITTFDLHDLSRLARTYGAARFHVVTPLKDQQVLAERILRHWTEGHGATYNRDRKDAVELIALSSSLDEALEDISDAEGETPLLVATDASRIGSSPLTHARAREILSDGRPMFLLFGTAWGLERSLIQRADYCLDPVEGAADYNHLSVRSAAAIILDRLAGAKRPF